MKQSLKAAVPVIREMLPFRRFIEEYSGVKEKFVAYCTDDGERRLLAREYLPGSDTIILIGPEGDFSEEEIRSAVEAGFRPVSLGEARLRTETAALTALETFHIVSQLSAD